MVFSAELFKVEKLILFRRVNPPSRGVATGAARGLIAVDCKFTAFAAVAKVRVKFAILNTPLHGVTIPV